MIFDRVAQIIVSSLGITGRAGDALEFWIYDSLKISFILMIVIFGVGYLRTYINPEKIKDYLKGKHSFYGYFLAAILGIISPFCSCSTIPIFLGFSSAGIPFGMTITFRFFTWLLDRKSVV